MAVNISQLARRFFIRLTYQCINNSRLSKVEISIWLCPSCSLLTESGYVWYHVVKFPSFVCYTYTQVQMTRYNMHFIYNSSFLPLCLQNLVDTMVEAMRAMMDELLGKERNVPLNQRRGTQLRFDNEDVCKYDLCGLCPYSLFKNTKSHLGKLWY